MNTKCEYGDKLQLALIVLPNFCVSSRTPYNRNLPNQLTLNAVLNNLRFSELYKVTIVFFFTLDAGLLARSQYSEGPATGHLDTGFSWFPYA